MDALATIAVALATAGAACLCWTVRTLWRLDRRVVRIETKLDIQPEGI